MKKKVKGGKRSNSGRKPVDPANKKIQLSIYVEKSKIEAAGGIEEAKRKAIEALDKNI